MWLTVAKHRLFFALNLYGPASFVSGSAEKGHELFAHSVETGSHPPPPPPINFCLRAIITLTYLKRMCCVRGGGGQNILAELKQTC